LRYHILAEIAVRKALLAVLVMLFLGGCGGPPPPPPPPPEPEAAYILEGRIYDDREQPVEGITLYLFPVGQDQPIGYTRSDSTGAYRFEMTGEPPEGRLLVVFNSNRHPHHDSRFLPGMDRLDPHEDGNRQNRLYYLTPVSEAPPEKGTVFVIRPLCNLRAAPSTDSAVIAHVKKGQSLAFLERDGDWIWVETKDGARGWIYRMLVTTLDHRMPE
jgi:hypothetical protein